MSDGEVWVVNSNPTPGGSSEFHGIGDYIVIELTSVTFAGVVDRVQVRNGILKVRVRPLDGSGVVWITARREMT